MTRKTIYGISSKALAMLAMAISLLLTQDAVWAIDLCTVDYTHGCYGTWQEPWQVMPCTQFTCASIENLDGGWQCSPPSSICTNPSGAQAYTFTSTTVSSWHPCYSVSDPTATRCKEGCLTCSNIFIFSTDECTDLTKCGSTVSKYCGATGTPKSCF